MTGLAGKLPDLETFSAALNTVFRASVDDGAETDFLLTRAVSLIRNDVQECFSLIFRAPADTAPVQALYRLDHASLGTMHLLLVPVKKEEDGVDFEAIFNHLVKK